MNSKVEIIFPHKCEDMMLRCLSGLFLRSSVIFWLKIIGMWVSSPLQKLLGFSLYLWMSCNFIMIFHNVGLLSLTVMNAWWTLPICKFMFFIFEKISWNMFELPPLNFMFLKLLVFESWASQTDNSLLFLSIFHIIDLLILVSGRLRL